MPPAIDKGNILAEFRRQVEHEGILKPGDTVGTDDETLLRFLRARKFDIKNSKVMLANCVRWRKTVEGVGLDALYDQIDPFDYPERETVFKYWPLFFHKTDKEGRPLNIQLFGKMNAPALHKEVPKERQWPAFIVNCESLTREVLPACSRAKGEYVGSAFCIIDLKGFSVGQFWAMKSMCRDGFQISQDYYPETMGRVVILNAPATFTVIWTAMKPWLAPETVAKIDILGSDYLPTLLKYVDPENLPSIFGGNCQCEGLGGCGLSSAGPWLENRVYNGKGPSKFRLKLSKPEEVSIVHNVLPTPASTPKHEMAEDLSHSQIPSNAITDDIPEPNLDFN